MLNASAPERRGWLGPALWIAGGVTLLRLVLLVFAKTEIFVDEAQYWFWGQHLAFGYYSKPPLIGWLIRAVTTLAGSDAPFWLRFPAPLLHGATGLILGAVAARIYGARAAIWVVAGYVTLPLAAAGSLLISTDTVMFPFLALALWAWLSLLSPGGAAHPLRLGLAAGAALGLACMAKYAGLYYVIGAGLAAALMPAARPPRGAVGAAVLAFLVVIAPNVLWNAANHFPTLHHTMDNVGWVKNPEARAGLHVGGMLEFLLSQFGVFGPIPFAILLWQAVHPGRLLPAGRFALCLALPVLALVAVQALLSRAYVNWAAAAFVAASLPVFAAAGRRRWLGALALAVDAALCLALPLATLAPAEVGVGPRPMLARYLGRVETSRQILAAAKAKGASAVVADQRDVLADLFYTGRDAGLPIYAAPPPGCHAGQGCFRDHYEMTRQVPPGLAGTVLFATPDDSVACAPGQPPVTVLPGSQKIYRRWAVNLFLVPGDCWTARG